MVNLVKNKMYRLCGLESVIAKESFIAKTIKTSTNLIQLPINTIKLQRRYWFFGWRWKTIKIAESVRIEGNNLIIKL